MSTNKPRIKLRSALNPDDWYMSPLLDVHSKYYVEPLYRRLTMFGFRVNKHAGKVGNGHQGEPHGNK